MSEIIMTEYRRGIEEITRDIREETGQFLLTALKIGRLLFEAKAMVEPGGWTKYIEEELPFSHSWANNYMKLYKEYGSNQLSLFGNSQTFANLRPTQALALLAIPAEERSSFVEENDVENMSTRQLQQAIRERDEAQKARQEAEQLMEHAHKTIEQQLIDAKRADEEVSRLQNEIQKANQDKSRAEKSEKSTLDLVEKLKKQLEEAQAAEASARQDLKKAEENPEIPETVMEKLRQDAAAEAAKQAAEELNKKLAAAEKQVQMAKTAREKAEQAAQEAEGKLAAAEKAVKVSNPVITEAIVRAKKLQNDFNELNGFRLKQAATDPGVADSIRRMMADMVKQWEDALGA